MKLTLTIKSCCRVSLTIPNLLTVNRLILLCSRWVNVPTLTWKTQLASIVSISCNIQHFAQQQSQCKLQWSMLRNRSFRHIQQANMANRHSGQPNDMIKRMKARTVRKEKECKHLGYCAPCNPKGSLRSRNNEKRTSQAMKRKRNGSRIMLREKPPGQDTKFEMQRQWFSKSMKIWKKLTSQDWWTKHTKRHFRRWLVQSETVWVIL